MNSAVAGNHRAEVRPGYQMWTEMFEQPRALEATLDATLHDLQARGGAFGRVLQPEPAKRWKHIVIVGMGTARHAGLVGKTAIQHLARIPVDVQFASEFREMELIYPERTLVVAVSQSGETGDTLAAVQRAVDEGMTVLALTNVADSSLARKAHGALYTHAGPEKAVPSTKAYAAQLMAFYVLALHLARADEALGEAAFRGWLEALRELPGVVQKILRRHEEIQPVAQRTAAQHQAFMIGRGLDWVTAQEGALKLKEVSYIHAEACEAGEFRHGTLALIHAGVPVVAVATQPGSARRMAGNVESAGIWGADIWVVATPDFPLEAPFHRFDLPVVRPLLAPVASVVPLQLFAYYAAVARGCDIDQPRNLTKSVTLE